MRDYEESIWEARASLEKSLGIKIGKWSRPESDHCANVLASGRTGTVLMTPADTSEWIDEPLKIRE